MDFGTWVAAIFLGGWLLLSVLVLVPRLTLPIRLLDPLSVIPEWKFFAPNPAQGDYCLLYRDQFPDGSLTPWTEVVQSAGRRWWSMLWNPGKRANKALFDAVVELGRQARAQAEGLEASFAYLTLLNYVSVLPRMSHARVTQFLILYSHASRHDSQPEMVFLSGLHSLERDDRG